MTASVKYTPTKRTLHISADNLKYEQNCKFWKYHSNEYEDNHLLACDVLCSLTFQRKCIIYPDSRNEFLWKISTYLPDYIRTGVDPGFVWPEAYTISGNPLKKQDYKHKIRYKSEYLFRAPPRTLEGSHASDWPWSLRFIIFMVNPPLHMYNIPEEQYNCQIILLHLHTRYYALVTPTTSSLLVGGYWCVHKSQLICSDMCVQ